MFSSVVPCHNTGMYDVSFGTHEEIGYTMYQGDPQAYALGTNLYCHLHGTLAHY